jgi:ABC-type branched-subunit amino acid transport system ATPase component
MINSSPVKPGDVLFEVKGLSKNFGGVRAVQDISFNVLANSVFAIIGPNGAGKSTALNLLSGTYQPTAGFLQFEGIDLAGMQLHERVRLAMGRTFQKIRLFKQLSVLENVLAGFHIHHTIPFWQYAIPGAAFRSDRKRCHEEAHELLEFVGLSRRSDVRAGSLAYGEQRMLEIARALATHPKLFMLDEPAAGLNGTEMEFLMERLKMLRSKGITVVIVEHNMDLVMNIADHVFVMDHGEYLYEGPPAAVQQHPGVISAYLGAEVIQ